MSFQSNPQLELAFQYVRYTNKNVFLTGKAGTGKTTFLHEIKKDLTKRLVVVAPTGVAAINAGGVTIHSFFQLPFGPMLPGEMRDLDRQRRFTGEKIRLIKSLDLLVIDEISMVRADLLDGIDSVLRRFKDPFRPFGGVQLLMIGDLHQLPPIVKDNEWMLLRDHYQTAYFFGSQALRETHPVCIELTHIFRQSDSTFIELLNRVRDNRIDSQVLEQLNSRFVPNFQPRDEDGYITLSSHNASAFEINSRRLAALNTPSQFFKASVELDFPAFSFPTEETLELKIGAQVMFVKNDLSRDRLYYNGKIGKITRFEGETIYVKCPSDYAEIPVARVEWQNLKFNLNEKTKEVEEEIIGSFVQYPLKLAWAITIHKSQGLTFERAIIDANAAFAHGQVYVALSRCKTFEGMVLSSKISNSSIKTDSVVKNYSAEATRNAPDEEQLKLSKSDFQRQLLTELFDFSEIKKLFERGYRAFSEHENSLQPGIVRRFQELQWAAQDLFFAVSEKFLPQLNWYFQQPFLPEENSDLQARVGKGSAYFLEKLRAECLPALQKLQPETDNKDVKKKVLEALENLCREVFVKIQCFNLVGREGFSTHFYLRTKVNAGLDFQLKKAFSEMPKSSVSTVQAAEKSSEAGSKIEISSDEILHPELVERLRSWRKDFAAEQQVEPFQILHNRVLYLLAAALPQNLSELETVKGMGKVKVNHFGAEIVQIVQRYCSELGIERVLELSFENPVAPKKSAAKTEKSEPKPEPSHRQTLQMFEAGKSISEIAAERGFSKTTIEEHLSRFVGTGELDVFRLVEDRKVAAIMLYFMENPEARVGVAREVLGHEYSFFELRAVLRHWERVQKLG